MLSTPATRRCLGGGKCECSVNLTGVTFRQVECRCHCLTCNAPDNVVPFAALVPGLQCPSSSSRNPAVLSNASQDPQQTTTAAGRRPSGCPFSGHAIARGGRPNAASERPPPAAASSPTPRSASSCCELVASTTPPSRYGHTLTEFFGGHFVLFGGRRAATQCLNDVWVLIPKLQLWVQLQDLQQVPSPRYGHSCHLHLVTNEDEGGNPQTQQRSLIFFGGSDGASTQYFDELQCLRFTASGISKTFHRIAGGIEAAGGSPNLNNNTNNNNNSSVSNSSFASAGGAKTAPLGRRSHTLVPYKNGRAVLFGGYRGVSLDDVWFLEPTLQWTKAATTGAPYQFARYSHSAVVHDDSMYVFGGFGPNGVCSNHVWVLHLVTLAWRPLETFGCAPCGRFGHSASLVGHKMVLFGGVPSFPSNESLNDCHTLNVISKEWTQLCAQVDEAASSCCTDCHHHHRRGGGERVGSAMALLESRDDGIRVDLRSTAEGMDASSHRPPLPLPTPQQREEASPVVADGTSSRSLAWSDAGAHGFEGNDVNEEEIEDEIDASLLPSTSQDGDAELLLASLPSDGARSPLPDSSSFPREQGTHEGPPPPPSVPPGGGSGMLPQSLSTTNLNLLPTTSSPNPQEAPHRALSRVGSSSSSSRHTPIPRRSHTAVIDSSQRHAIVIFGGWNGGGDAALSASSSSASSTTTAANNNTVSGGIAAVPTESTMDGRCFHMILAPPTLKEMVRDQIIRQGGTVSTPPHHNDQPGLHRHEVLT